VASTEHRPIITLTTDFGYREPLAGIMKGVILNINPSVHIIDITHAISPQNIMEAAFSLEMIFKYFPHKTIHIAVVDPGVGSERRPVLVATDYHYFVGPDNGIFSRIYSLSENFQVIHITADHYFLPERSATFHGRDIFSPVAAWLSKGLDIRYFGDTITDYVTLPIPLSAMSSENVLEGEVIYIERFGNLITNISAEKIKAFSSERQGKKLKIFVKGIEAPLKIFYAEAKDKGLYALMNSFGYLELFVNSGNASRDFAINVGEKITVIK
jgi:S-adenosylmethionine hydrolase